MPLLWMLRLILAAVVSTSQAEPIATAIPAEGHAHATWISSSPTASPGTPIATAVRLKIDPGWHTYWTNPGETGLPTRVRWHLPPDWHCGPLVHPPPTRFLSSNLTGFGHAGEVWFPVTLTPPANFSGTAVLRGTLTWLACSEHGCVPGSAEISLQLEAGTPSPSPHHATITSAIRALPRPARESGWQITATERDTRLLVRMKPPESCPDLSGWDVFPVTAETDPAIPVQLRRSDDGWWTASATKSPYLTTPITSLQWLLVPPDARAAIEILWNAP